MIAFPLFFLFVDVIFTPNLVQVVFIKSRPCYPKENLNVALVNDNGRNAIERIRHCFTWVDYIRTCDAQAADPTALSAFLYQSIRSLLTVCVFQLPCLTTKVPRKAC